VKLKLIQRLIIFSLEKKCNVKNLLNQFSIFNKKRTEIKKLIIDLSDKFKNHNLREPKFEIVHENDSFTRSKGLPSLLITKSKNISFYKNIHSSFHYMLFKLGCNNLFRII
jgi:hypothetical protein